jgi:hypothetical protein
MLCKEVLVLDQVHAQDVLAPFCTFEGGGYVSLLTMLVSALYTLLIASAVSPFMCTNWGNGTYALISSPSIQCFVTEWKKYALFIYFFIILYGIIFPSFLGYHFFKNRHNTNFEEFIRVFWHLMTPYRADYYYWDLVAMIKRAAFAVISQLV